MFLYFVALLYITKRQFWRELEIFIVIYFSFMAYQGNDRN